MIDIQAGVHRRFGSLVYYHHDMFSFELDVKKKICFSYRTNFLCFPKKKKVSCLLDISSQSFTCAVRKKINVMVRDRNKK